MKRSLIMALVCAAAVGASAQTNTSAAADSVDRAVAVFVAGNFKIALENAFENLRQTGVPFNRANVEAMVYEEFRKPYDAEAAKQAAQTIENIVAATTAAESTKLLEDAAAAPGAQITPDGVVFQTVVAGTGASPSLGGSVTIRYTGSLPDGYVFDSIGPLDEPMTVPVSELTPGMSTAMPLMKAGGKYVLTIPPAMAYGDEGVPGVIPPNCALRFEVELVAVPN